MSKNTTKPIHKEESDERVLIQRLVEEMCMENDGLYAEPLIALLKMVANPEDPTGALLTAISHTLTYTDGFKRAVTKALTEPAPLQALRAVK